MNGRDEHDRDARREQLAAYVLGALDPAEAVELESHLAACSSCREELHWFDPAIGALAASVPQLNPPGRVRRRTMAAARAEAGSSSERSGATRFRLAPAMAGLAAILVVAGVGVGYLAGSSETGTSTVALEATGAREAGGTVVTDGDAATLEVVDLQPLRRTDVYQAWLQRGDVIEPSTTFIVDDNGAGAAAVPGVSGAGQLMVTREPRGGSTAPSTAPILRASLDAS